MDRIGLLVFLAIAGSMMASAQQLEDETTEQYLERLKVETAQAVAEAAAANAEVGRLNAQLALLKAQQTDQETALELSELDLEKQRFDKEKAAADAEVAAIKADIAKITEPLNAITDSGLKGEVTVDQNTGKLEAALLSAEALKHAAKAIRTDVMEMHLAASRVFLVVDPDDTNPALTIAAYAAEIQKITYFHDIIEDSSHLGNAIDLYNEVNSTIYGGDAIPFSAQSEGLVETLAIGGAALDAGKKLLSYFKTDYKMSGLEATLSDFALVSLVAANLDGKAATLTSLNWAFEGTNEIEQVLSDFEEQRRFVAGRNAAEKSLSSFISQLRAEIDKGSRTDKKQLLAKLDQAVEHLKRAKEETSNFEQAFAILAAGLGDASNALHASKLLPALALDRFKPSDGGGGSAKFYVMILNSEFAGGSYYTKKNIGTGLGGMPFEAAGGVVVSYTLLDPTSGEILGANLIAIHGGYKDIDDIASGFAVNSSSNPTKRRVGSNRP